MNLKHSLGNQLEEIKLYLLTPQQLFREIIVPKVYLTSSYCMKV